MCKHLRVQKAVNFAYGQGGLKLEINIPPQHISAKSKGGGGGGGGLIIEGGVTSSEYGTCKYCTMHIRILAKIIFVESRSQPTVQLSVACRTILQMTRSCLGRSWILCILHTK